MAIDLDGRSSIPPPPSTDRYHHSLMLPPDYSPLLFHAIIVAVASCWRGGVGEAAEVTIMMQNAKIMAMHY